MHLSDFDYELPRDLIAQAPLPERDASRLMVVDRQAGSVSHRDFREIHHFLARGDRLVVNDTKVIPARLFGQREGGTGQLELLLLHPVRGKSGHPTFHALSRPARKVRAGTSLYLGTERVPVKVLEEIDDKTRMVEFPEDFPLFDFLEREGHIPLPPYIQRSDSPEDRERYQTLFAAHPGAVAAPTAGLHFTPKTVERLNDAGMDMTAVTLNVGAGTFTPVTLPDPREHRMEREYYRVTGNAREEISGTRAAGGKIVCVGTTVVRVLESAEERDATGRWTVAAGDGWTEKFIYPPYEFHLVDALLTNFHLPRSTLLMLVSAFAGLELTRRAYHEAVREKYRFYSYGDAMLVL